MLVRSRKVVASSTVSYRKMAVASPAASRSSLSTFWRLRCGVSPSAAAVAAPAAWGRSCPPPRAGSGREPPRRARGDRDRGDDGGGGGDGDGDGDGDDSGAPLRHPSLLSLSLTPSYIIHYSKMHD